MLTKKEVQLSQQEFIREAMKQLGMTRDEFGKRISVPRKTLDKWLAPMGQQKSEQCQKSPGPI